jgi:hypothetical protein
MEAQSDDEKLKLSREALLHDPDCVDALVQVALLAKTSYNDRITRIGEIAKKAKGQLGEEFFKSYCGHFWVVVESRPYMRTLKVLIELLRSSGRGEESITICEQMLVLDPGDHEGVRDALLGLYLKGGKISEARGLIENWKEFPDAVLSWGRVLERFLSGDSVGASDALLFAIEMNPYVAAYLLGRKPKPKQIVDFFSVGDENEARYCVYQIGEAWVSVPTALSWLASRLEEQV